MQNFDRRQGGISTQIVLPPQFKNYDHTLMATPFMSRKFAIYAPILLILVPKNLTASGRTLHDNRRMGKQAYKLSLPPQLLEPYYAHDGKSAPPGPISKTNGK